MFLVIKKLAWRLSSLCKSGMFSKFARDLAWPRVPVAWTVNWISEWICRLKYSLQERKGFWSKLKKKKKRLSYMTERHFIFPIWRKKCLSRQMTKWHERLWVFFFVKVERTCIFLQYSIFEMTDFFALNGDSVQNSNLGIYIIWL